MVNKKRDDESVCILAEQQRSPNSYERARFSVGLPQTFKFKDRSAWVDMNELENRTAQATTPKILLAC